METHFDTAFYWTQSCLLYLIGQQQANKHLDRVLHSLGHEEAIVRETSAWSIAQLNPRRFKANTGCTRRRPTPRRHKYRARTAGGLTGPGSCVDSGSSNI